MILLILIRSFLASGEMHAKLDNTRSYIFKIQTQTTSTARAAMVIFFSIQQQ